MASNGENVSIWWRHRAERIYNAFHRCQYGNKEGGQDGSHQDGPQSRAKSQEPRVYAWCKQQVMYQIKAGFFAINVPQQYSWLNIFISKINIDVESIFSRDDILTLLLYASLSM